MDTNRLTTIDEVGSRKFVIPAEVQGPFRTWRNRVYFVLLIIFLGLPWLKINGLQAVLLDIPHQRFEIFGKLFLPHDSPLIFLLLAIAAMGLAFVTAVWGRVWCGWACPQTVFIDGLYRKIEILIEGNYIERRRLQRLGFTFEKLWKSGLKWFAYFVVSSIIAHSFIAYFTGSSRLLAMVQGSPQENWTYFLFVSVITVILMFNFGWFREQFCTIMCPYGRFQSVLMDNHSLTILYDEKRGEPRKSAGVEISSRGDCVSCNRCVEVCPAKIDIRDGLQMECIGCTACIDACNVIMRKIGRPENLIRYANLRGSKVRIWRPRTAAYFAIMLVCTSILAMNFSNHSAFSVTLLRAKDTPYQLMNDNHVLNHLKAHLFNQSLKEQEIFIELTPETKRQNVKLTQVKNSNIIPAGERLESHFFISFPSSILDGQGEARITFLIRALNGESQYVDTIAVGPRPTD